MVFLHLLNLFRILFYRKQGNFGDILKRQGVDKPIDVPDVHCNFLTLIFVTQVFILSVMDHNVLPHRGRVGRVERLGLGDLNLLVFYLCHRIYLEFIVSIVY